MEIYGHVYTVTKCENLSVVCGENYLPYLSTRLSLLNQQSLSFYTAANAIPTNVIQTLIEK